jgi:hypothetical protein
MTGKKEGMALFDASPPPGPVALAVEAVLDNLADRIGPGDVAHVAAVRVLAAAIDTDARRSGTTAYTLARATGQLVAFLDQLVARTTPPAEPEPEPEPDALDVLVTRLSAATRNAS